MPTALILGASRGIGRELVRQLLAQRWRVLATARDKEALAALRHVGAQDIKLDVTSAESIAGLGWQLDGERIDLALYVAGVFGPESDATTPPAAAEFDRVMHANVLGAMQVLPIVAPLVEAAGGKLGVFSSAMGGIAEVSSSYGWLYRVSKAALNMALASASFSYPKAQMVALHPGWVQTDMGGPNGTLTVEESVADLLRTLAALKPEHSGKFLNHDGKVLPW